MWKCHLLSGQSVPTFDSGEENVSIQPISVSHMATCVYCLLSYYSATGPTADPWLAFCSPGPLDPFPQNHCLASKCWPLLVCGGIPSHMWECVSLSCTRLLSAHFPQPFWVPLSSSSALQCMSHCPCCVTHEVAEGTLCPSFWVISKNKQYWSQYCTHY